MPRRISPERMKRLPHIKAGGIPRNARTMARYDVPHRI
jgi:hypothetical protein